MQQYESTPTNFNAAPMKNKPKSLNSPAFALFATAILLLFAPSCDLARVDGLTDGTMKAQFNAIPASGNAPLDVSIVNQSVGAVAYAWSFGDGTPGSSDENPETHRYVNPGNYQLRLITTDSKNNKDTATTTILVLSPGALPVAGFDISGGNCNAPCSVNFTNTSAQASSFSWNFGDNSPLSTAFNPSHPYEKCGDYIVTLVAYNGTNTDTLRKPVSIRCATFEQSNTALGTGISVTQNSSGGFTVVGSVLIGNNTQIYSCRYSKEGVASPPNYYGSTKDEYGTDVLLSSAGTTVVLGVSTNVNSNRLEGYFTTEGNNTTPTKIVNSNRDVWLSAVIELNDGGFMLAGSSTDPATGVSNILLARTNASLVLSAGFPKEISLPNSEEVTDMVLLPNGNVALIGTARETANNEQILLLVVNTNGDVVVSAKYFGGNNSDYGKSIVLSADQQSLYLLGTSSSVGNGQNDIYLTRTDLNGNVIGNFPRTYGTSGNESAGGLDRTDDGGLIIVGAQAGTIRLIKVDANGLTTAPGFSKSFGDASSPDAGSSVKTTSDGGFILCGQKDFTPTTGGHLYLIKTDQNGNL